MSSGNGRAPEITNQPPPFSGHNAFAGDPALGEAAIAFGADWVEARAMALGAAAGEARVQKQARDANRYEPELRTYNAAGERVDEVDYHPAYHDLMTLAFESGVHSLAWTAGKDGAHVGRAVMSYIWNQIENGVACPVVMTYSAPPTLALDPDIDAAWGQKTIAEAYDPELKPIAEKASATIGMTLTENQGGSDLRANESRAEPAESNGPGVFALSGNKWFCSAPMCDAFVTLAQTQAGPTCFFLPRILPDGSRNAFHVRRLKEKCGNRSNASSEVEFDNALVWRLGEEGRGIATVIAMAQFSRSECAIASAGIMRYALSLALHFCSHRRSFQKTLIDQPLMAQVLADLAVESEAAMWLGLRMARAIDESANDEAEWALARLLTPVSKFWICKRTPPFVAEALECMGGNGYIEEHVMARLYREAPLNGIWEGSGNVVALDVLRALQRNPEISDALFAELAPAKGQNHALDKAIDGLESQLSGDGIGEAECRRFVGQLALVLQASLLVRHAPQSTAQAFCNGRLGAERGIVYGSGASQADFRAILQRAAPQIAA